MISITRRIINFILLLAAATFLADEINGHTNIMSMRDLMFVLAGGLFYGFPAILGLFGIISTAIGSIAILAYGGFFLYASNISTNYFTYESSVDWGNFFEGIWIPILFLAIANAKDQEIIETTKPKL